MTVAESRRFAVELLAWNYRVTAVEVGMLGLFLESDPIRIVCSAIDTDSFWNALKNVTSR
jgi:hypothetical protein